MSCKTHILNCVSHIGFFLKRGHHQLSYWPIFKHFVMADHCFQSNSGAPKNQHQLSAPTTRGHRKNQHQLPTSSASQQHQKPAKSAKISNSAHPATFPGASHQPPSTASSSSLPKGQPAAFPGASQPSQGPASSLLGASQQSSSLPARMELYTHIWIM